jgi:hypothetical protein
MVNKINRLNAGRISGSVRMMVARFFEKCGHGWPLFDTRDHGSIAKAKI